MLNEEHVLFLETNGIIFCDTWNYSNHDYIMEPWLLKSQNAKCNYEHNVKAEYYVQIDW